MEGQEKQIFDRLDKLDEKVDSLTEAIMGSLDGKPGLLARIRTLEEAYARQSGVWARVQNVFYGVVGALLTLYLGIVTGLKQGGGG